MANPPTGSVTFLFTDIEGSTRLWEEHAEPMRDALLQHDDLLRACIETYGGHVFKTVGDAFCAAFFRPAGAVEAVLTSQQWLPALALKTADGSIPLRVRMAIHTGVADLRDQDYFGPAVNRVSRLLNTAHGGQIVLSGAAQEALESGLPAGVSLQNRGSHRLKDLQQPEQVFQLLHPDLPAEFPPLRSLSTHPNNLPQQLTSFIGREREIADLRRLMDNARLLTLTGSGGCGKTRLALQVAAEALEQSPDGVWLVELAPLSDPTLVPQTVANALGLKEESGISLTQTVVDHLQSKHLLLLMDNCEHLLEACAKMFDTLLRGCPGVRVLATSRQGLGLTGEQLYRVPSLQLPDAEKLPSPEQLGQFEAVRLLVDRACLGLPTFTISHKNAAAVAAVCHRLDGIPLAIELAAARVKALPVEQIASRLDDRFRLLTGGNRTALPRHQTLRALIDWSYDLLSEAERKTLTRLSVFAGGWKLEAAEELCGSGAVEDCDVLELLTALVDKSLVLYEDGEDEARYRLLETLRQYGSERLAASGESETLLRRHFEHYLRLAEQAAPELRGTNQSHWLELLESEHDNLRAALDWALERAPEGALQLSGAVWGFWLRRGYFQEGGHFMDAALSGSGTALPASGSRLKAEARALHGAGTLAGRQWDYVRARCLLERSVTLYRQLGDLQGAAGCLNNLGVFARDQGDYSAARSFHEQSLTIYQELGKTSLTALTLCNLGSLTLCQGDFAAGRTFLEQSLALSQELGDRSGAAYSLMNLGWLRRSQGDYSAARSFAEQSLNLFQELGERSGVAHSLGGLAQAAGEQGDYAIARSLGQQCLAICREINERGGIGHALGVLGLLARRQGEWAEARTFLEESIRISRQLGDQWTLAASLCSLAPLTAREEDPGTALALGRESLATRRDLGSKSGIAASLEQLAGLAAAEGHEVRAARLFGAAQIVREQIGAVMPPADQPEHVRQVGAARTALGEKAFDAAWQEGRVMALEQAIELALEDAPT
jgi:predicted ATPase/class 3 adenylate cyclase